MRIKHHSKSRRDFLRRSLAVAGACACPVPASYGGTEDAKFDYDLVIYGGTSAAVTAAVQARRMGRSVVIVCPEKHLGGLTTSGLGWTDSKNGNAIGGLAREFYQRVWQLYSHSSVWTRQTRDSYLEQKISAQPGLAMDDQRRVMWTFEPHAAERVVEQWLASEQIPVFRDEWLDRTGGVIKRGATIIAIRTLSGKRFSGRMFLDAGYEGDLMAAAGVEYRIGRDSAHEFGEPLNGIRFFVKGMDSYHGEPYPDVDPYVIPGKPESGLIAGIESTFTNPAMLGEADAKRLQCFTFRLCLTNDSENRVPFARPADYDERHYELLFRLLKHGGEAGFTTEAMPNRKTDANSLGHMSGDFVGGSFSIADGWTYSDASYARRKQIVAAHRSYQAGLLWTLQNHQRVPARIQRCLAQWGLSKDEFIDNGNWPYQLYVREARRMVGVTMVTQHHVQMQPGYAVANPIGLGSYSLDSHVVRRVVVDGKIRDEGGFYVWCDKPYPLPYGCIVPQRRDATNLLSPVALSATHAAFGSIRMEPTYMILGQAAATAAVLALKNGIAVQDVNYGDLAKRLAADGQRLTMEAAAA
jgi:hypothetical protein